VQSRSPISPHHWQWIPSRSTPLPPKAGGTTPLGDVPELMRHVCKVRRQGATIAEAEQVWNDGMALIGQRAAQFAGNGPVINDFYGVISGEWRVYVGRPAIPGKDAFAMAFNIRTGVIATGHYPSGIRPHPALVGQEALFNFQIVYP
jgi:hypothetical protein